MDNNVQLTHRDYSSVRNDVLNGTISIKDMVSSFISEIDDKKDLNAFVSVLPELAMQQAEKVDEKIKNGTAGKLAGMVLGLKDLLVMKDTVTSCASKILSNFESPYNATAVQKILDQDVIVIGKTNMDEFAMGSSNENSFFGPAKNPHDPTRVPGGSSGGSAVAVGGNLCMTALGTDTGGSIRQPASFCGTVGLKPTYGRVSRFGLVAYASSLDQIGPITKSVKDASLLLEVISGYDKKDSTSFDTPVLNYSELLGQDIKGLKVGLPKEYFAEGLNAEVRESIQQTIDMLKNAGAEIVELSLPHTDYAIAAYYIIATAEASSNLARFDGVRYGVRSENSDDLESMYVNSRTEGFGEEVKRRIMLGTYVLSSGYYDAYYKKAQQVRTLIKKDFENALNQVDVLLTPVAPTTAFKIGEKSNDPVTMYLSDIYTVSLNLAGLPGISVPSGADSNNMPIGVQLIGKAFDESTLLNVADFIEQSRA